LYLPQDESEVSYLQGKALDRGLLSVLYLPRMAAAYPQPGIAPVLRESVRTVLLPSAARRTHAIAVGELLSLPLFALLVFLFAERLTLELIGLLWTASYAAYAGFNFWMCARR
jgi:hypothetical protein